MNLLTVEAGPQVQGEINISIIIHTIIIFPQISKVVCKTYTISQCGPTTGSRATCGPSQCFQCPTEAFRKNLKI